jgi:hypothetical protein
MSQATPVIVNVYDLADFNNYVHCLRLGAYHSGVECHGREYAFGGTAPALTNVFTYTRRTSKYLITLLVVRILYINCCHARE